MSAYSLKQAVSSFSTPTITLGAAVSGFNAFSSVDDGIEQNYIVFEGDDYQICSGVYTHSGTTLAVTHMLEKSVSGTVTELPATGITFTSAAEVIIGGTSKHQSLQYKEGVYSTNHFIPDNIMAYDRSDGTPGNEFSAVAGRITLLTIRFNKPTKITAMGFNISTASASDNIRGAIYHCNSDGSVGDLIQDSGNISTTSTGLVFATLGSPIILDGNTDYYQANMADNTVVRAAGCRTGVTQKGVLGTRQGVAGTSRDTESRNQYNVTYGAFPTTLSSVASSTNVASCELIYQ